MAVKECGLKNDALMDTFYDVVMERYAADSEYAILVFHDRYDIPAAFIRQYVRFAYDILIRQAYCIFVMSGIIFLHPLPG